MNYTREKPLLIPRWASVVTYDLAREIAYNLGLVARRETDYLLLFKRPTEGYNFYCSQEEQTEAGIKPIARLYVDEGFFSDVWQSTRDPQLRSMSHPWEELVDFQSLLAVIVRSSVEKFDHPTSSAIGRGRRQSDLIEGWLKILGEVDWAEVTLD